MTGVTQTIITAALAGDETITKDDAEAVIRFLSGDVCALHFDKVVTIKEAARRLGKRARTIRWYCKNGVLKGYKLHARTTGIYESSLAKLGV